MPKGIYQHYFREKSPNWRGGIKIDNLRKYKKRYSYLWRAKHPNCRKDEYIKNKESIKKRANEWNKQNSQKRQMIVKRYREKHLEEVKKRIKEWAIKNPIKITEYSIRHQKRLKEAQGSFTIYEWINLKKKYNNECAECGSNEKTLEIDHIFPLSKGGNNYIVNIQPLCRNCNARKGNKI